MANPKHLDILRQGVDVWNEWREENPDIPISFSNIDLGDLPYFNFENAFLFDIDFDGSNICGINLYHAIVTGSTFRLSPDINDNSLFYSRIIDGVEVGMLDCDVIITCLENASLQYSTFYRCEFFDANLQKADLSGANFVETSFTGSDLSNATLRDAVFHKADLNNVNLRSADLTGAKLLGADLRDADLASACLKDANLSGANLSGANLSNANLHGTNLSGAILVETNLTGAKLIDCLIYGLSVWDVTLENTQQLDLVITAPGQPKITVDQLKIAQFIYLLLNNQEISRVIDTITSKVVLILGRFTPERKQVLDVFRDVLRNHNYSPVIFNFEEYNSEGFIETVRTLANMAHFVLIDLTDLDNAVQKELATSIIPRCVVPIQPLLLGNRRYDHTLFRDLQKRCRWVLPSHRYRDTSDLITAFKEQIIQPVEQKITELKQRKPLKIFFGYTHEDQEMLDTLKKHLKPLERSGQIEMWDNGNVEPGNTKNEEIEKQLSDAQIILLLMSPDFIASNDCYVIQERAMEFYEQGKAKVIPILLRSYAWKSTPLGQLQVLPRDERPMKEHDPDNIFFEVSEEIGDVIKEMM